MIDGLGFDPYWVDINQKRFPENIPKGITKVIAKDPALISSRAPENTVHIVITHSHSLDQAICHAVLASKGFSKLGLIGSKTKKARFKKRLEAGGVDPALLKKLICPVGLQSVIGKTPQIVAISIAAQLAIWQQENNNCA